MGLIFPPRLPRRPWITFLNIYCYSSCVCWFMVLSHVTSCTRCFSSLVLDFSFWSIMKYSRDSCPLVFLHSWFNDYVGPVVAGGGRPLFNFLFFLQGEVITWWAASSFSRHDSVFLTGMGSGICSQGAELLWVSELMEILFCHVVLKGTLFVLSLFRGEHMHQGERTVMWGMHSGRQVVWMVLGSSEFNP